MYINGMASIAAQTEEDLFAENLQSFSENIFPATSVNYKEYIKPMMLRRMSKAIKMGLVTAKQALNEAGVDVPDSIIVGTGEGCKQDTEKFLENILDENLKKELEIGRRKKNWKLKEAQLRAEKDAENLQDAFGM